MAEPSAGRDEVERAVVAAVAAMVGVPAEQIGLQATLTELDLDSIARAELVAMLRDALGVNLRDDALSGLMPVQQVVDTCMVGVAEAPSATSLMELASGFWAYKTLAAAVELDLFTRLAGGRKLTVAQATAELGMHKRPAAAFLAACASVGLLDRTGMATAIPRCRRSSL